MAVASGGLLGNFGLLSGFVVTYLKSLNDSSCNFYVWLGEFQKIIMIKLITIEMSSLLHCMGDFKHTQYQS